MQEVQRRGKEDRVALSADARRGEAGDAGGNGAEGVRRRLFADEAGVLWTAELRSPPAPRAGGEPGSSLILFWSETRACLAMLKGAGRFADLTDDDLRRHLEACLSG